MPKSDDRLPDSYAPLGNADYIIPCEDDGMRLETRYLEAPGLYVDVEVGSGPAGWV